MADAIILATAHAFEATLWTQDAHFKGLDGVMQFAKNRESTGAAGYNQAD